MNDAGDTLFEIIIRVIGEVVHSERPKLAAAIVALIAFLIGFMGLAVYVSLGNRLDALTISLALVANSALLIVSAALFYSRDT